MKTNDTLLLGEISSYETNRSTKDYKIVLLHCKGNRSLELVYLPCIVSKSNSFSYDEQTCFTHFSEAVESLWMKMFEFQDRLDNAYIGRKLENRR